MPARSNGRRPRAGAATNLSVAIALCLVIALVSLTQSQTPPPAIAEISPQANKIQDAPAEQASRFGRGAGGDGLGDAASGTTTTTEASDQAATTATTVVPRTRKCVGNPPRQIEDPQSPPCVPFWVGDNGGSTWKGVTRDTINVVLPNYDAGDPGLAVLYEAFFNHRFEFYGRKMKLIDGSSVPLGTPDQDEAGAATMDEQYHAFAVGAGPPSDYYFYAAAARRGIVAENTEVQFDDGQMNQLHNVYQYFMGVDSQFANLGNWACRRLVGGNAVHAGPLLTGSRRVFGTLLTKHWQDNPMSTKPLDDELGHCGQKTAVSITTTFNSAAATAVVTPADAENDMLQMKEAGVTSVFCLCEPTNMGVFMHAATAQGYFPEWLLGSYIDIDNNLLVKSLVDAADQMAHGFGISFQPRAVTVGSMPPAWAAWEEDPGYTFGAGDRLAFAAKEYWAIFQIAAGLQMAGPHLTPQTFEEGLRRAQFPNPITKIMEGAAGFNDPFAAHSMTKDGAEIWWSNDARDPTGGAGSGSYCYVDGGTRHRLGTWPAGGDPFFQGSCDTGAGITAGPTDQ